MSDDTNALEARRVALFQQLEKYGLEAVRMDLTNGGYRLVGGPPATRDLAWEWVRMKEKEQEAKRSGGVTFNIGSIGNAVGIGVFGDNANISATQSLSIQQLAESVRRLVDQSEKAINSSDLPDAIKTDAGTALAELRTASTQERIDPSRLKSALNALKRVMEHGAGHVVAVGILALIDKLLSLWPG
jgi:hypothetical protein